MTENLNIDPEATSEMNIANTESTQGKPSIDLKLKPVYDNDCVNNQAKKLEVYNWLKDIPESEDTSKMVEVQFKNTRKGYYLNSNNLELNIGDTVAVESSPGHDIGQVTLTGKLVLIQMKKNNYRAQPGEQKRVYRIAKPADIEKCKQAKSLEHSTMIRSREIAEDLKLQMKIGDVEYQGDGNKAIFYYIADERVDFRQLIKVLAEEFHVRIEMKQIGARQEAGRIGGIGPCGRQLCCSSWMSNFVSVSTSAARYQDISLNPQKLAGQCGKLKCCLNYEIDQYVEAQKKLPSQDAVLETLDGTFFHFKTDIFSGQMTYSSSKTVAANLVTIPKERVFDIIQMNKAGTKPKNLGESSEQNTSTAPKQGGYKDLLEDESITRFDNTKKKKKKLNRNNPNGTPRQPEAQTAGNENTPNEVSGETAKKNGNNREERLRNNQPRTERQQQSQPNNNRPNKFRGNRQRPSDNGNNNANSNINNGQRKEFKKKNGDNSTEN